MSRILSRLVAKCEKSKGYYEGHFPKRIFLQAEQIDGYFSDDAEIKKLIHRAIHKLYELGFVEYVWVHFEKDNLLDKVYLRTNELERIYAFLNRRSLKSELIEYRSDLENICEGSDWSKKLKNDAINKFDKEKKFDSLIPKDREHRQLLIMTINGAQAPEELSERIFSVKYLGDSKLFENKTRGKLVTILKNYVDSFLDDEQLLQMVGIMKNYDEILLKGCLQYNLENNVVDITPCINGTSINSDDIQMMTYLTGNVKKVITIENKTAYHEYRKISSPEELVIYLGGFFGKWPKMLIKILESNLENVEFYHWGDIDLGGILIYNYLDSILEGNLKPLFMSVSIMETYSQNTQNVESAYVKKLEDYREKNPDSIFKELISHMIITKTKLEQEVLVAYGFEYS